MIEMETGDLLLNNEQSTIDDEQVLEIIQKFLNREETISSYAQKLKITERHFNRLYQKERRQLLTKDKYTELRIKGYQDCDIAYAYGYTRQSLFLFKQKWDMNIPRDRSHNLQSSHSRQGKPNIETKWGPAYEYRRGYYLVRFKKDSPYFNHPIAPHHQCLLHRIVVLDHLLETDPKSEFLVKINGCLTLDPEIQIHHRNGDSSDNNIDNLEINWSKKHLYKHWHGASEMREAFLEALKNRESLSKDEILKILAAHYDDK